MTATVLRLEPEPPAIPDGDELEAAEAELHRHLRAAVSRLGIVRAADVLGRSTSWVSQAICPDRDRRNRCKFSAADLLKLLWASRAADNTSMIEFLAGEAFGADLPADELVEAYREVLPEVLGDLADELQARVRSRALVKRLRRDHMRTRRSAGQVDG